MIQEEIDFIDFRLNEEDDAELKESWRLVKGELESLQREIAELREKIDYMQLLGDGCQSRLEAAQERVAEWESVFGHLSTDPDSCGNLIYEEMQQLLNRIKELEKR